jgi:hypothetical protein
MTSKGKSGAMDVYYLCRGRQEHQCELPYIPVAQVEAAVSAHYATVRLPADFVARVRAVMDEAATSKQKRLKELSVKEDRYLDLYDDGEWLKEKLEQPPGRWCTTCGPTSSTSLTMRGDLDTAERSCCHRWICSPLRKPVLRGPDAHQKRVLNTAIFTKLDLDDLDDLDGQGVRVVDDELTDPFATVVYAWRTEVSMALPRCAEPRSRRYVRCGSRSRRSEPKHKQGQLPYGDCP